MAAAIESKSKVRSQQSYLPDEHCNLMLTPGLKPVSTLMSESVQFKAYVLSFINVTFQGCKNAFIPFSYHKVFENNHSVFISVPLH